MKSHHFLPDTMRVDVYHVGNSEHELFTLDRVLRQKGWSGSRATLLDPFEYGAYRYRIEDPENGKVLFDYRLRPGVVTKSNALDLMRSIGLEV